MAPEHDIAAEVVRAEAAAWLVRLQQANRDAATESAFKEWMRDPAHARAFAHATAVWEIIPGAARVGKTTAPPARGGVSRLLPTLVMAGLAVTIIVGGLAAYLTRNPVYTTKVGEMETVTLSDGTRVALNTDSKLVVAYTRAERRLRLERGEAMFEVTKNPQRPLVVQAGQEQVRALGTTFTVRRDREKLAVVLLEGRVEVGRRVAGRSQVSRVAVLAPGQRLTVRSDAGAAVDYPKIETAIAWRRGELMFDGAPLLDAVAELNRYGGAQVQVGDPTLAALHVSGVFQTHDPAEFALAIAELHHLRVVRDGDTLVLWR
jgi:transmembrane sensor